MIGWLITAVILILLWFLPLGVRVIYNQNGIFADLLIGFIPVKVYPGKKNNGEKSKSKDTSSKQESQKNKKEDRSGGSYKDFVPLIKMITAFLGDFRRKLVIKRLEMKLVLAGDDPCDLAVSYGSSWAAVGNLFPQLERFFTIKKRDVEVLCDFTAEQIRVFARLDLTLTVGRILCLGFSHGVHILKEYFRIMKLRKGGMNNESKSS